MGNNVGSLKAHSVTVKCISMLTSSSSLLSYTTDIQYILLIFYNSILRINSLWPFQNYLINRWCWYGYTFSVCVYHYVRNPKTLQNI